MFEIFILTLFLNNAICQKEPLTNREVANFELTEENYRLPTSVIPQSYIINLTPDFDNFNFLGVVEITAKIIKDTQSITLHANNLVDILPKVFIKGQTNDLLVNYETNSKKHFLILNLSEVLSANTMVNIKISYKGFLNENNIGFYRAAYIDKDGNER